MITTVTKDNFDKEITEAKETVLVDFWAAWCMPVSYTHLSYFICHTSRIRNYGNLLFISLKAEAYRLGSIMG